MKAAVSAALWEGRGTMVWKSSVVISVFVVSIYIREAVPFHLTELFDVVNVLRLTPNEDDGFEEYGNFSVDVAGEARGLPLIRPNGSVYEDTLGKSPCCRNWTNSGFAQLPPEEAEATQPLLNPRAVLNNETIAPIWVLNNTSGVLISPLDTTTSQRRFCVTLLARLPRAATLSVWAQRPEDGKDMRIGEIRGKKTGGWQLRQLIRGIPLSHRYRQLRIIVKAKQPPTTKEPLLLQWCSRCLGVSKREAISLKDNYTTSNVSAEMRSVMLSPAVKGSVMDPICRHGGSLDLDYGLCVCSPGFTGVVCEKGCGRNKYGVDCGGRCSKESQGRQCKGVKVCATPKSCKCVAGWKGSTCDTPCPKNKFGPNCKHECGRCKNGQTCDSHTGRCGEGCQRGYQPPFCTEVCGKPPLQGEALISNGHEANPEDHPWSVALYYISKDDAEPEHICSASLVRPRFVLSAAHCVYQEVKFIVNPPEQYKLGFGKFRRKIDDPEKYPQRVQIRDVRSIHVPKEYRGNRRLQSDDIALLEMFTPVEITPYVRPVCVDSYGGFDFELYDGDIGDVVGWGLTELKAPSPKLLIANPRFIPTEKCFQYVPADFIKNIGIGKFCAGDIGGAAVDHGDSGAGLVFDSYLRGIVSVAPTEDFSVTSYTNVSAYRNWFTDIWDRLDVEAAVRKHLPIPPDPQEN